MGTLPCPSHSPRIRKTEDRQLAVIGSTYYGIDIEAVIEILPYEQPTRIADSPPNVLGVLEIRGGSVPIADLGACLGRASKPGSNSRTVILALENSRAGFVVDEVAEVVTIPSASFQSNRDTLSTIRYVTEIAQLDDRIVLSLDHQAVVDFSLDLPPIDESIDKAEPNEHEHEEEPVAEVEAVSEPEAEPPDTHETEEDAA